jgi:hypothetical protein
MQQPPPPQPGPRPPHPDAIGGERYLQNYVESSAKIAAKSAVNQVVMFAVIAVVGFFAAVATIVYMIFFG